MKNSILKNRLFSDIDASSSISFIRRDRVESELKANTPSRVISAGGSEEYDEYETELRSHHDYLVWVKSALIRGDKALVFSDNNLLGCSTTPRDWQVDCDLTMPNTSNWHEKHLKFVTHRRYANYYHWTFQCVSSLLDMKREGVELSNLVVPPLNSWRKESLELAGVDLKNCYELDNIVNISCEKLLYSSYSSTAFAFMLPARFVDLFTEFSKSVNDEDDRQLPERVYLSRENSNKRVIENENEIIQCAADFGFEKVVAEELSVREQIRIFSNARHVLAPHGAGLANLLYATRCESVSEIFQQHYVNPCMYKICDAKNIPHYTLKSDVIENHGRHNSISRLDINMLKNHLAGIQ